MIISGVPEVTCMELLGHKTSNIFKRYAIVSQADEAAALRKTMEYVNGTTGNVVPMRQKGQR